ASIHGLHAFQVHRETGAYLRAADRSEQEKNIPEAIDFLRRYRLLAPHDKQAMERLGKLLVAERRLLEAQGVLRELVQQDRGNDDLGNDDARRLLTDVSIRFGRYEDAQYHLKKFLLKSHPTDGALWLQLGQCYQGLGQYVPAVACLAQACQNNPASIAAYERLAKILADRPQTLSDQSLPNILKVDSELDPAAKPAESVELKTLIELGTGASPALSVIDLMLKRNQQSYEAHLGHGQFFKAHLSDALVRAAIVKGEQHEGEARQKMLATASDDAHQALRLAPSDLRCLLFAAQVALTKASTAAAEKEKLQAIADAKRLAQRACDQDPSNVESYLILASIDLREKKRQEAVNRLAQGLTATHGEPVLLWTLADLRIDANEIEEASALVDRLKSVEPARPIAQYLSARMLIAKSKWAEARRLLEASGPDLKAWPQIYQACQFWRAQCYSRLGRDDLAVGAYHAALEVDPSWATGRLALAETLRAQGRIDESIAEFRQLPDGPDTKMARLRLEVLQNLAKPQRERNWAEVEEKLNAVIKQKSTADALLLLAEIRVAQDKIEGARQLLREALSVHSAEATLWSALVSLASRREDWNESERILREMRQKLGDNVAFRLTNAEYLVRRFGSARKNDLRALAVPPATLSSSDRFNLNVGMARMAAAVQDYEQAERLWKAAADDDPGNLQIPLFLFDLALQMGKTDAMKQALDRVEAIEHSGPISLYGKALQLVIEAKDKKDDKRFDLALSELEEARLRRPGWFKIASLVAEIHDSRGNQKKALENYLEAIQQGERNSRVIARAFGLLYEQKEYARAEAIVRELQDEKAPFSMELTRIASEASVRTGDLDRALTLAQTAARDSKNVKDRLWLATVLQLYPKTSEAESEFQRARTAAPTDPSTWIALIQFYSTTGKTELARQTLEQFQVSKAKIDPVVLAYAYQLTGRTQDADKTYDAVMKTAPGDFSKFMAAITYKLRLGHNAEVESLLRKFLDSSEASKSPLNRVRVRRTLATLLAASGAYPKYLEAHELIKKNLKESSEPDLDLRTEAIVDASFPTNASRERAMQSFAKLDQRPGILTPEDRLVFAKLLSLSSQHWAESSKIFLEVVRQSKETRYIAAYVDALLGHAVWDEADVWIKRLEEIAPNDFLTADQHARLLVGRQRYPEAFKRLVAAVGNQAGSASAPAASATLGKRHFASMRLETMGNDLMRLKRAEEAGRFFNQAEAYLASPDGGPAKPSVEHLQFLIRRRRNAEILEEFDRLCEGASAKALDEVSLAVAALRIDDPKVVERLEQSVGRIAGQHPTPALWVALATLQDRLRKYDEEESSLRRALQLDGKRTEALNNLAYILALRKKNLSEARQLVKKAIDQVGPRAAVVDSLALVELMDGQADAAQANSANVVVDDPSGVHLFHLAQGQLLTGNRQAARESLQNAIKVGLTPASLHPLEVARFEELRAQLEPSRG
ncbi:MAG TPA: tetratricopeptide repeat protein, partial [Planctomycetaceae bacterium]|nr:tetratricopeptide repeat protein [Planctomycetaceae bacterium]